MARTAPQRSQADVHKAAKPAKIYTYKDKKQVELDVSRVSLSKAAAAKLERRVGAVLSANPPLSYYQGFHDIAMHTHTTKQLENLSLQQLRDFMAGDLKPTMAILRLVPQLLNRAAPAPLQQIFERPAAPNPSESRRLQGYFALQPVVTLFAHDVEDSEVIAPIIRTVLKEGLAYVLYLYAALVIDQTPSLLLFLKERGLTLADEDEVDVALQNLSSKLTRDNYGHIDRQARRLRSRHPLPSLPAFQQISKFSVLKTPKITKRSTALHMLEQLEKTAKPAIFPARTVLGVTMGVLAVGMLYARYRK